MKQKIMNFACRLDFIYKLAVKLISNRIVREQNLLTPKYLTDMGWIEKDGYYFEPNIKDRDLISISFEKNWFRVWHGKERTFIALESKVEWFEIYYLLSHDDNGRYELAGI